MPNTQPEVRFRYRRPGGSSSLKPSPSMREALRHLSQAREMQPLLTKARQTGREVVIEVFHSSSGEPLLIHPTLLPQGASE